MTNETIVRPTLTHLRESTLGKYNLALCGSFRVGEWTSGDPDVVTCPACIAINAARPESIKPVPVRDTTHDACTPDSGCEVALERATTDQNPTYLFSFEKGTWLEDVWTSNLPYVRSAYEAGDKARYYKERQANPYMPDTDTNRAWELGFRGLALVRNWG